MLIKINHLNANTKNRQGVLLFSLINEMPKITEVWHFSISNKTSSMSDIGKMFFGANTAKGSSRNCSPLVSGWWSYSTIPIPTKSHFSVRILHRNGFHGFTLGRIKSMQRHFQWQWKSHFNVSIWHTTSKWLSRISSENEKAISMLQIAFLDWNKKTN